MEIADTVLEVIILQFRWSELKFPSMYVNYAIFAKMNVV